MRRALATFTSLRARRQAHQIAAEIVYPPMNPTIVPPAPAAPQSAERAHRYPCAIVSPYVKARETSPVKLPAWLCHRSEPVHPQPPPRNWPAIIAIASGIILTIAALILLIMFKPEMLQ
jgi:hypothetical protein